MSKTIVLTSDCEPILTYERRNTSKTGILIRKIDAVTKLPLAGVTFRITPRFPLTGEPFERTTEEAGIIIEEGLEEGTYTIEEIAVPDGYVLDPPPKNVQIKNQQDTYTVTFENHSTKRLYILKLDEDTRLPLKGAAFEVLDTDGNDTASNLISDKTGWAYSTVLPCGNYTVREIDRA